MNTLLALGFALIASGAVMPAMAEMQISSGDFGSAIIYDRCGRVLLSNPPRSPCTADEEREEAAKRYPVYIPPSPVEWPKPTCPHCAPADNESVERILKESAGK